MGVNLLKRSADINKSVTKLPPVNLVTIVLFISLSELNSITYFIEINVHLFFVDCGFSNQ